MSIINQITSSFTKSPDFGKLIGVSKNSNIHVYKKDGIIPVLTSVKDGKVIKKIKKAKYLECYKNNKLIRKVVNNDDLFVSTSYPNGGYEATLYYKKNGNNIYNSEVFLRDSNEMCGGIGLNKKEGRLYAWFDRDFRFPASTKLKAGYDYTLEYPSFKPLKKEYCTDFQPLYINFSLEEQDEIYSLAQKLKKMLIDPLMR